MNLKKKLLILAIIGFCFCIDATRVFGQFRFDSWTTDDGLPQNGVRAITQTPDGYLWFTTFDGLVRFDGVRFATFGKGDTKGIVNNRFTSLFSDKKGTLFAATAEDGILTVYENGVFKSYSSAEVPGNYIRKIEPDENGEARFQVEDTDRKTNSWYYLRNGKFVFIEIDQKKGDPVEYHGSAGSVWTVHSTHVVESRNGKKTVYTHNVENLDSSIELFEDSKNRLWIGGRTLTTLKDGHIKTYGVRDGYPKDADFHSFWEETDGSVWFANGGRSAQGVGLVRYHNEKFSHFGTKHGLSEASIFDVLKDREGNVWLATNKGINRLRKNVITAYSERDGIRHSEVYPLFRDSKDQIWIGTIKGLSIFRNGKFEKVELTKEPQELPKHLQWRNDSISVQSIFEDSTGTMWIGASGGIFLVKNGLVRTIAESEGYFVYSIHEEKPGRIWAATNKGLLLFNDYKIVKKFGVKHGLPHEFMTVIKADSHGNLWFGGLGGLSKFADGKFTNYTSKDGLTGNYVRTIHEDKKGFLWIGTYDQGLSLFENGEFKNFRAKDGLFNNGVFAIREDRRGHFWISSNRGIYRVRRQELIEFAEGKIRKITSVGYGKEDGMLNNECNGGRQPASLVDKNGHFWFPTQDGVVIVDPSREVYNPLPPTVVVESATVERSPVDLKSGLIVPAGARNIEIRFTGISLVKSAQIRFKYKLEGHDTNWIDAETRRTAFYSYLPPGNYNFRVKAANSDGVWSENGAQVAVKLEPFFYQTTWFYVLCILIFTLLLITIWKVSVYQLRARETLLKKLVNERTEALKTANRELEQLANSDGLTAIGNRRRFEEFLAGEWHRAIRFKTEISLILLDIDHFKRYNDTYGHLAGDECLKQVAEALNNTIHRPTDLVARFGGEEFAIVLGGTDADGAMTIAEEAFESVNNLEILHEDSETSKTLTVSVGIATTFAELGDDEGELVQAADEALYLAKESGRNQIICSDLTKVNYHVQSNNNETADHVN